MFKVVIADDEALILKNLQSIIPWCDLKCEVVGTARDGQKAFSLCEQHGADLLLTDISMPGMTGLNLLKKLDTLPKKPLTVMISGYDYFEYAREALKNKAFDYILKPVDYEELYLCIERGIHHLKEKAEREYEVEKQRLYEVFTKGSYNGKTSCDFGPMIPILLESASVHLEPPVLDKKHYSYSLSPTATFILTEWPTEELPTLREVLLNWNEDVDNTVLIGSPVVDESLLKPALEELKTWMSAHRLVDEDVVWVEELKEKHLSKKSAADSIGEASRFIHDHYQEDISAEQAAGHANMSISYFSLLFKQVTGFTFLDYLTGYRMERACFLLLHTELKTYEIAEKVGYGDPRYFSQVFRKRLNVTPSEYRKKKTAL
ncbi:response regulator [Metabacillus dongyingensis]|uniref:response regulator transcription factor n=1 Tax=Metabacillus dongyingensis TaxID=2874282 RepID=UPI003B8C4D0A